MGLKLSLRLPPLFPFLSNPAWSQVSHLPKCPDGSVSSASSDHLQLHCHVVQRPRACTPHSSRLRTGQAAAGTHYVPGTGWVKRIQRWTNLPPAPRAHRHKWDVVCVCPYGHRRTCRAHLGRHLQSCCQETGGSFGANPGLINPSGALSPAACLRTKEPKGKQEVSCRRDKAWCPL